MPRSSLLVLVLMMIVLTSRIDLKPYVANEVEATNIFVPRSEPQESLKEKIILSQEKSIQKLNGLVQTLQKQLELCRANGGNVVNDSTILLTEFLNEIEHH